jgi:hypothetical protein
MSNPHESGMLTGGGAKGAKIRRHVVRGGHLRNMPDVHITDGRLVKQLPPFQEGLKYTQRELHLLSEKMILEDPKPYDEPPYVLSAEQYRDRMRKEVYVANGVPDPSIAQGMYWRTHPQGRKVNTAVQRKVKGRGFYR